METTESTKDAQEEPTIWRIHIRPGGGPDPDPAYSFAVCRKRRILGVGWRIANRNWRSITWPKYRASARRRYKGIPSAPRLLAEEIKLDDLMWTRDENHVYYLARVVRPWSYIGKRENLDADVINTVGVRMIRVGVESHVPGKIIAAFRAGRTLQRVIDPTIAAFSKHVFNQLARSSIYSAKPFRLDIFSLLSADDCEDLVYVYLQTRGYIVFPSRRQRDTQSYEYVLVHRKTGREAIAQVKTGKDVIPIDNASWPQPVDRVYAFSPNEMYKGRRSKKVHLLRRRQMLEFMKGNRSLLPPAIGTWMDIAANGSGRIDH